jgi:undecaprenyl diphosphate synthase
MNAPRHVAIIMDGNRRWAREKGLDVIVGHRKMAQEGIRNVVQAAIDFGIQYLTLWAFSTENWNRDPKEVKGLMNLFRELFSSEAEELHKRGVRIKTIGDLSRFDSDIQENIARWTANTKDNTTITVVFALNYGGRDEIVRAAGKIAKDIKAGILSDETPSQETFSQYTDTASIPDPDLIIRPGGEKRLSGFLLWQSNYAELYFTQALMPDFGKEELRQALEEFNHRKRRFGG